MLKILFTLLLTLTSGTVLATNPAATSAAAAALNPAGAISPTMAPAPVIVAPIPPDPDTINVQPAVLPPVPDTINVQPAVLPPVPDSINVQPAVIPPAPDLTAVPIAKPKTITTTTKTRTKTVTKTKIKTTDHSAAASRELIAERKPVTVIKPKCITYPKCDPWSLTIAPYAWGINMNGSMRVVNRNIPVKESFSDILRDFKGGGMLWIEANKRNWGLFANLLYAYLDRQIPVGSIVYKPIVKFGLYTFGGSYQVYTHTFCNCTKLAIVPYIGARYTNNNIALKVINTTSEVSTQQHWVDPIIGTRFNYTMNSHWLAVFAGDVGGIKSTQKSYNLNGYIGYVPTTECYDITLYGGYRLLYQNYTNGNFVWKMHLFGPVVGIAFKF